MRLEFRDATILQAKFDFDAAYRRVHVHPDEAVKTITVLNDVAHILTRVPFGVSPGSFLFSGISEPVFDLTNSLLRDKSWNPESLNNNTVLDFLTDLKISRKRASLIH